jgi:hypothetical protein
MSVIFEWPGRCSSCGESIEDWSGAGLFDKRWVHKACYTRQWNEAHSRGETPPELQSPVERGRLLELPMLIFLLMFHFGLGGLVAGWIMLDQDQTPHIGTILVAIGIIVPLIGIAGVALNILSRRRVQMVEQALDLAGGWKPGP